MQNQELIDALTPIVALLITHLTKWLGPKIPKWIIPIIAIGVGTLTNVIATMALDGNQSLVKSVLLGLAAIALRETGKHWVPSKNATNAILVAGIGFLMVGCATWEQNSYRTLATTQATVDGAMKIWAGYVAQGLAKPEDEAKVKQAYQRYQQAMAVARIAVTTGLGMESSDAKTTVGKALDGLAAAAADIVGIVRLFSEKGKI